MTLEWASAKVWLAALLLTAFAAVGAAASLQTPTTVPARSDGKPLDGFRQAWKALRADRILWLAFLGQIVFWSIASLIPVAAFAYVSANLKLATYLTGLPLAALGIGMGIGSVAAGRLSGG